MGYLLLIENGNADKNFEGFQFLKDAVSRMESIKNSDEVREIEYMEIISIGETYERFCNPDCCSE